MPSIAQNSTVNISLAAGDYINVTGSGSWSYIATVSGREIASGSYVGHDVIGPFTKACSVGITCGPVALSYTTSDFVEGNVAAQAFTTEDVTSLKAVVLGDGVSDAGALSSLLGGVTPKVIAKSDANNWYLLVPKAGQRGTGLLYQISQGSAVGDAGSDSVGTNFALFRVAKVVETLRAVGCFHTPSGTSGVWTGPTAYSFAGQASGFGVGAWNAVKYYATTAQNAYKEYSITVGRDGKFSVGFVVGSGMATGVKVTLDTVDLDTFSLVASASTVWSKEYSTSPGTHTVRVTKTDAGAGPMQILGCNFYDADQFPDGNSIDALGYARTANYYKNASTGAIEYAMQAIGTGKWAGSYHGGETRSVLKLLVDGVDVSAAATGSVYAGRDITLIQETSIDTLAGTVAMQSTHKWLRAGGHSFAASCDAGTVPMLFFYTHMDVVEAGFSKLVYPKTIDFTGYANNSQVQIGKTELTVLENPATGQRSATWSQQFRPDRNSYGGARVWVSSGVYNKPYNGPVVDWAGGAALGSFGFASVHAYG